MRLGALALLAFCLALGSCRVQRFGPDHGVYCALGKSADGHEIYCPKPKLNGGWPAPFLFDRPGISVENRLSVGEDDFRWPPFLANASFYLLILLGLERLIRRRAGPRGRS